MSIFSKDLIKEDLHYRPNPVENMDYQIVRYFNKLCEMYSPNTPGDPNWFLKDEMKKFLDTLKYGGSDACPDWWEGPFSFVINYDISSIDYWEGVYGVVLTIEYGDSKMNRTSRVLHMYAPPIDFQNSITEIYENWVL